MGKYVYSNPVQVFRLANKVLESITDPDIERAWFLYYRATAVTGGHFNITFAAQVVFLLFLAVAIGNIIAILASVLVIAGFTTYAHLLNRTHSKRNKDYDNWMDLLLKKAKRYQDYRDQPDFDDDEEESDEY